MIKQIPEESIDMIVTDPPYGIKYQSNSRQKTAKFDVLKNDDNDARFDAYPKMFRVLKNNAVCAVFCSWKNFAADYDELSRLFNVKNVIVWYKGGGGMGDLKHTLATDYELCIICHKGRSRIRGKREGCVWRENKVNPNKMLHATEKPIRLLERIIEKWSDVGMTIFDPFAGSGSTGVACVNTGRRFIGYELDHKYFDIAKQRINDAVFSMERDLIES